MLNREKLVANPALHSFRSSTIDDMLVIWEVKGAEIDAYAIDKESPMSACLRAPQSLAPSPHIATFFPNFWYSAIPFILSFGLALANTVVLNNIYFSVALSYLLSVSNNLFRALPVMQSWTSGSFNLSSTILISFWMLPSFSTYII